MAQGFQPQQTRVQYGDETVYGTPVAVTKKFGTVRTFTPRKSWEVLPIRGVGDGRETQNYLRTRLNVGGTLVHEIHDWEYLKFAVGPFAGAGTSGDPFTVTEADFTGVASSTEIIPFTLEVGSEAGVTDNVDTYSGCHINTVTLDFVLGQAALSTSEIVAKDVVSSTSATAYTALTTHPWVTVDGSFLWGQTPSAETLLRSASITYANNFIIFGDWATNRIEQPETGERLITWRAQLVMTASLATTMRDDFYGQANTPVDGPGSSEFESDNELHVILDEGGGSGDRHAEVKLDQCIISDIQRPIDIGAGDLVLVTFVGNAKTSKGDILATYHVN